MSVFFQHFSTFFSHARSRAVGLVFAADGFLYGSWSALIPTVKSKFGLDAAQLGLLLFTLPLGITLANPLAAWMIGRYGMRQTTIYSLALSSASFALPIAMPSVWLTGLALFFCGLFFSILNVAMNTCATSIEHQEKMRIMSTCHGMWSLGAMSGSAMGSTATGLGVPAVWHMAFVTGLVFFAGLGQRKALLSIREENQESGDGATFLWPNAVLWGLIVLSLCTNLAEGAMADWAAVYMRDIVAAPAWLVGWGFAAYAFFMASGRMAGDMLLLRYGSQQILRAGGALVALGFGFAVFLPGIWTTLTGFALVGAGVSLGAPILYAAAARAPGMAPGAGLATMNTFAMATFLAGPTAIGFLAKATTLPIAFTVVGSIALFWSWKAGNAQGLDPKPSRKP
ncbi:MAG: MFS transporter [Bacteroidetes bacterium]|nr:MFS transporter [Bacteroidota bacterium]